MARYNDTLVNVALDNTPGAVPADVTLVAAPGSGNKIRVYGYMLQAAGAVALKLTNGAAGTVLTVVQVGSAGQGMSEQNNQRYLFECGDNTALVVNQTGAGVQRMTGRVTYAVVKTTDTGGN